MSITHTWVHDLYLPLVIDLGVGANQRTLKLECDFYRRLESIDRDRIYEKQLNQLKNNCWLGTVLGLEHWFNYCLTDR